VLDQFAADPELAELAAAIRRVLAGERDPAAVTAGLDKPGQAVVVAILAGLSAQPTAAEDDNPPRMPRPPPRTRYER